MALSRWTTTCDRTILNFVWNTGSCSPNKRYVKSPGEYLLPRDRVLQTVRLSIVFHTDPLNKHYLKPPQVFISLASLCLSRLKMGSFLPYIKYNRQKKILKIFQRLSFILDCRKSMLNYGTTIVALRPLYKSNSRLGIKHAV